MRNSPYQAAARIAAFASLLVAACGESIGPDNVTLEVPPLRIAGTYAETGAYSAEGRGVAAGYRLAVEMLNEQGGIGGRTVQLDLRDDASDPDVAADIYRQLAADTAIDLLLSPFSSAVTEAVLPVVEAAGRPFVAAPGPRLRSCGKNASASGASSCCRRSGAFRTSRCGWPPRKGSETVALVWEDSARTQVGGQRGPARSSGSGNALGAGPVLSRGRRRPRGPGKRPSWNRRPSSSSAETIGTTLFSSRRLWTQLGTRPVS